MILLWILVLIIVYIKMIDPGKKRKHPVLNVKYYAHRGFHGEEGIPENSMAAFKKSKGSGYGTRERIPRFVEVLREVDGKVPLLVELKMETCNRKLCKKVAKALDQYKGLYCMECFHPYALYWFKKNRPEVIRGQLSEQFLKEKEEGTFTRKIGYFIVKNLLTNFITKPDFIAYHYKYKDCLPLKICRRFYKIPIYGWTFRDKKAYKENEPYFEGFIFEKFVL